MGILDWLLGKKPDIADNNTSETCDKLYRTLEASSPDNFLQTLETSLSNLHQEQDLVPSFSEREEKTISEKVYQAIKEKLLTIMKTLWVLQIIIQMSQSTTNETWIQELIENEQDRDMDKISDIVSNHLRWMELEWRLQDTLDQEQHTQIEKIKQTVSQYQKEEIQKYTTYIQNNKKQLGKKLVLCKENLAEIERTLEQIPPPQEHRWDVSHDQYERLYTDIVSQQSRALEQKKQIETEISMTEQILEQIQHTISLQEHNASTKEIAQALNNVHNETLTEETDILTRRLHTMHTNMEKRKSILEQYTHLCEEKKAHEIIDTMKRRPALIYHERYNITYINKLSHTQQETYQKLDILMNEHIHTHNTYKKIYDHVWDTNTISLLGKISKEISEKQYTKKSLEKKLNSIITRANNDHINEQEFHILYNEYHQHVTWSALFETWSSLDMKEIMDKINQTKIKQYIPQNIVERFDTIDQVISIVPLKQECGNIMALRKISMKYTSYTNTYIQLVEQFEKKEQDIHNDYINFITTLSWFQQDQAKLENLIKSITSLENHIQKIYDGFIAMCEQVIETGDIQENRLVLYHLLSRYHHIQNSITHYKKIIWTSDMKKIISIQKLRKQQKNKDIQQNDTRPETIEHTLQAVSKHHTHLAYKETLFSIFENILNESSPISRIYIGMTWDTFCAWSNIIVKHASKIGIYPIQDLINNNGIQDITLEGPISSETVNDIHYQLDSDRTKNIIDGMKKSLKEIKKIWKNNLSKQTDDLEKTFITNKDHQIYIPHIFTIEQSAKRIIYSHHYKIDNYEKLNNAWYSLDEIYRYLENNRWFPMEVLSNHEQTYINNIQAAKKMYKQDTAKSS